MKSLSEIVNEVRESEKRYKGELPKGIKKVSLSKKFIFAGRKTKLPYRRPIIKLSEPLKKDILVSVVQGKGYEVELIKSKDRVHVAIYKIEKLSGGGTSKSLHTSFYEGDKEIMYRDEDQIEILEAYLQGKYSKREV